MLLWGACLLLLVGACEQEEDAPAPAGTGGEAATATTAAAAESASGTDLYDVSGLVDQVRPAVVAVTQSQVQLDYFGNPMEVPAGAGTGAVIDDEGGIITNNHVVEGAQNLIVTTAGGEDLEAELVATAPSRDLALIRVPETGDLAPLPLGDSESLEVGEPVVAIGNALGLDAEDLTVSVGIVSAKDRTISVGQGSLSNLIQTDAAINPGNSGGPLINRHGEIVGINTAIAANAQNVGFAIAVDTVKEVLDRLQAGLGEPYLGVAIVDNSEAVAARLELDVATGALVVRVREGSPAAEAGVERFDVITALDGQEIASADDLTSTLLDIDPGTEVSMQVVRNGQQMTLEVTVGSFPPGQG